MPHGLGFFRRYNMTYFEGFFPPNSSLHTFRLNLQGSLICRNGRFKIFPMEFFRSNRECGSVSEMKMLHYRLNEECCVAAPMIIVLDTNMLLFYEY